MRNTTEGWPSLPPCLQNTSRKQISRDSPPTDRLNDSSHLILNTKILLASHRARTWLAGAGFPRDLGNKLVSTIDKVAQTTKGFSAEQLDACGAREFVKLQRAHGAALEERLQAAAVMINQLEQKQPGLNNLLKSKGIGDNALVASMLIRHAAIYHARNGR